MSMGHSACTAWTISDEDCAKVCKKAWNNMVLALGDKNMSLDELAQHIDMDDYDIDVVPVYIMDAVHGFRKAFEKKTGLSISLGYHNSDDEGDRYDDIDGHFWDLGGVTYMTAKAKRLGEKIKFSTWVTFG